MNKALSVINLVVVLLLTTVYFYQFVYTVVGAVCRRKRPSYTAKKQHSFAALICARNESPVIGELVQSLKEQHYPKELFDIYVLADNCTDDTADAARRAGALVYERNDKTRVGKGFAMDFLIRHIKADRGEDAYDAFFVFDADNIVDPEFVAEMNKTYDQGYEAATSYRNSKNFASNWISADYSIWFLREARFMNYPRMLLGNGCAVSGTGFMVSNLLIKENNGWPFHLLTEDIQFSVNCAIAGHKIGYCDNAVVYDEQPTSFAQSWKQRLRWSKGFYQVDAHYLLPLARGAVRNKGRRMTCYDMLMTVIPCMLLTIAVFAANLFVAISALTMPHYMMGLVLHTALRYLLFSVVNYYVGMFAYGALTVACEWKHIRATNWEKIKYLWSYPIFGATYIPITIAALSRGKVEWSHIEHHSSAELAKEEIR